MIISVVVTAVVAGGSVWYLTKPAPKPGPGPLKIGRISPITGDLSFINPGHVNASKLAVKDINEAGGIFGENVELIVEDTGTDPVQGADATRRLIDVVGVHCIVGPASSGVGMGLIDIVVGREVPIISPCNTAVAFTKYPDKDFYFRTVPSDALQGAAMANFAYEKGYRTAGILSRNEPYGIGLEEVFQETFEELGGEVLQAVRYDPKAPTFKAEVRKATEGDPDVFVLMCLMEDGVKIVKTASQQGITKEIPMMTCEGFESPKIPDKVGKNPEGEYIVWEAKICGATPYPVKKGGFVKKFKEYTGEEPWAYMDSAYDATILFALAAREAGDTDPKTIRDHLRSVANPPGEKVTDVGKALGLLGEGKEINYQGYSGEITYDDYGDVEMRKATKWWYAENGAIVKKGEIGIP